MAKSKYRGHDIEFLDNDWKFSDNKELVSEEKNRKCGHCKKDNRLDGHDSCLGHIPGLMNACCGHGEPSKIYIQFLDGFVISGNNAKIIIDIIKKENN